MRGKTPAKGRLDQIDLITLTPAMAAELLEGNTSNRPINNPHVNRIARQIMDGKWKFNGDTIKIAVNKAVLDGQHRLWAVIEANMAVETVIVTGIEQDAFSTIDTIRRPRSGADVVAVAGQVRYRGHIAAALGWLLRWQRDVLVDYADGKNRVENSDIETAFNENNPGIIRAVERAKKMRMIVNQGVIAFVFYIASNRNAELAETMMRALEEPGEFSQEHPFFRLRTFLVNAKNERKPPLDVIAHAINSLNAAHAKQRPTAAKLRWCGQGKKAEPFPKLKIG